MTLPRGCARPRPGYALAIARAWTHQVRFQGEADMNRQARLAGSVKNDPEQT